MSRTRRGVIAGTALTIVCLVPSLALACPMCIASNEANRDAFLGTTVLLSLLPLAMFGGFLAYVLHRAAGRGGAAERPTASSAERPGSPAIDVAQSPDAD